MYTVKINDGLVEWAFDLVDEKGGDYSISNILDAITDNLDLRVVSQRIASHTADINPIGPCEICGSKHHHLNGNGWLVPTEEL